MRQQVRKHRETHIAVTPIVERNKKSYCKESCFEDTQTLIEEYLIIVNNLWNQSEFDFTIHNEKSYFENHENHC